MARKAEGVLAALPCCVPPGKSADVPVGSWNVPPRPHEVAPKRNLLSSTEKALQEKSKMHLLLW